MLHCLMVEPMDPAMSLECAPLGEAWEPSLLGRHPRLTIRYQLQVDKDMFGEG